MADKKERDERQEDITIVDIPPEQEGSENDPIVVAAKEMGVDPSNYPNDPVSDDELVMQVTLLGKEEVIKRLEAAGKNPGDPGTGTRLDGGPDRRLLSPNLRGGRKATDPDDIDHRTQNRSTDRTTDPNPPSSRGR